ncbi:hypothetical protein IAT40_002535 [Kwoniella sp. CBS 6097]
MQLIALFTVLCVLGGANAAPVPAPLGLLGGLLPLAPAPSASPSTPLNLNALLNELHITLPEGLVTTLGGIDFGALNEIDLAQFVTQVLSFPGVQVPAGTNTTEIVNAIVEDVGSQVDNSGLYDSPTSTSASLGLGSGAATGVAPHINQRSKRGFLANLFGGSDANGNATPSATGLATATATASSSPTISVATPKYTDLLGGIIGLSDINSALTATAEPTINNHGPTPTANENHFLGLPNEIALPPYVDVSPSLTIEFMPTGTAKGPLGLLIAEISADVDLLGAKFTLGPIVNL